MIANKTLESYFMILYEYTSLLEKVASLVFQKIDSPVEASTAANSILVLITAPQ